MPLITVSNISKSFAQRELFYDVSFEVDPTDRIGLVEITAAENNAVQNIVESKK